MFVHLSLSDTDRHEKLHVYLVIFRIMSAYDRSQGHFNSAGLFTMTEDVSLALLEIDEAAM